ncbi:MAG: alpha/beta fold hydrolase, partial [Dehalococcoidia bacterium]|nr:alpha/beta fold hydrolase [Dehalococcoidia bacterium]
YVRQKYKLILWEMRGHGRSDSPEDPAEYSEARTMEDMKLILDTEGVNEAVIGGLSLGGYMTFAFYLADPEMTKALIPCDTGPGYRNPEAREGWNKMAHERADEFESQGLAALSDSTEVQASVSVHKSAQGLARAARGMLTQVDGRVMELLPNITVPTLIVLGANDEPFVTATDYMEKKIPGSRKLVIADAGHASNMHQPQVFNDAVLQFLDEVWKSQDRAGS